MITKTSFGPRSRRNFWGKKGVFILETIYTSPTGNKENIAKKFKKMDEEIGFFQEKGNIILQRDFNAHTKK